MNNDFSELKRLAEAATPGPWECREAEGSAAICHKNGWVADDFSEQTLIDTRYMAAANPTAVLELIAYKDALAAELRQSWVDRAKHIEALTVQFDALNAEIATMKKPTV